MRLAMVPWLDFETFGAERFDALLHPAISQALEPVAEQTHLRIALALALPSARPGLPLDLESRMRAGALKAFPGRFSAIGTFAAGHAAGFIAMRPACDRLAAGEFDACVVAGVDSYLSPDTLAWLEENDQLHSAGVLNNAWGFIPGEAAAAVLLMSADAAAGPGIAPLASVLRVGTAVEAKRIKTDTVCTGEGLTAAFRETLGGLPDGALVTDVFCDLNGEPYRADEFGFACLRTREAFVSASDFVAPADIWGDVSAASVPLFVMLAAVAARKAYANGGYAFLWASSETGERGASLLSVPAIERE